MVKASDLFRRWIKSTDARNRPASPIELLVLCALRYMGRGWTFDDLEESTGISKEVIRVFFHQFIAFGSTVLYNKFIEAPTTAEQAADHTWEFTQAGFPGAIGSTDATHVMLEKVSHRMRQAHLGFKMCHTARTYNVTVNHRRRILSTTSGHPARWNDKTLVLFDTLANSLRDGSSLQDLEFELYDYDESGLVVTKKKYRGAWLLVDNGYLSWPVTVPPIKTTINRDEIRFSSWLESMRKDVECTFGILKGRWRILKAGIRLHGTEAADKIWLTCCALHNWLLTVDGLDEKWQDGVASDWEGSLGLHEQYPTALQHLMSPEACRNYDAAKYHRAAGIHDRDNYDEDSDPTSTHRGRESLDETGATPVKDLSLDFFRSKLIRHFAIAYGKHEISWPARHRCDEPVVNM